MTQAEIITETLRILDQRTFTLEEKGRIISLILASIAGDVTPERIRDYIAFHFQEHIGIGATDGENRGDNNG